MDGASMKSDASPGSHLLTLMQTNFQNFYVKTFPKFHFESFILQIEPKRLKPIETRLLGTV